MPQCNTILISEKVCYTNGNVNDGSITLTGVSGGVAPYTYKWSVVSGGSGIINTTIQNQTGLGPGTYRIEVTDANGCKGLKNIVINQCPVITIAESINYINTGMNDGSITLTGVSGGVTPYTYKWSVVNGGSGIINTTIQNHTGLSTGTYRIEVTDANGCKGFKNAVIQLCPGLKLLYDIKLPNLDMNDGAITIKGITGGIPPYEYNWSVLSGGGVISNPMLRDKKIWELVVIY